MSYVLVVDDESGIRNTLCAFLRNVGHRADSAPDAMAALEKLEQEQYDIVITDIIMPRMSGMDLLARIRERSDALQVIMMTGDPTVDTAISAVQVGANDYLVKPVNKFDLIKAVNHADQVKCLLDAKRNLENQKQLYQEELERQVAVKTSALSSAMRSIVSLLATVVEARDPYTAGHQRKVGNLAAALAAKMGFGSDTSELIRICGYIHDIGKIAVPTEILCKPGKLSDPEMMLIREHPTKGYELLSHVDLPPIFSNSVYQHHERCNGSGYPRGLTQEEILPEAHIIMVADVVEAMMSHRPYRPLLGLDKALEEIQSKVGEAFDPEVVSACVALFCEDHYHLEEAEQLNYPF